MVCHNTEPYNGSTDRDVVWVEDTGGSKESRVRWKRKERKTIYIAPFRTTVHTKRSGMDHTVLPANNTMISLCEEAIIRGKVAAR